MTAPHCISENKSNMRGIKPGRYAVENDGNLVFWTLFQPRGYGQGNHSADEWGDGVEPSKSARLFEETLGEHR